MSIKKTKNGTYQLRLYIPEDVQAKLGLGKLFERKYKNQTRSQRSRIKNFLSTLKMLSLEKAI